MLTDLGKVKALYAPMMDTARDAALTSCIAQASTWVHRQCGLYLEQGPPYYEYLSGCDAKGPNRDILPLDARRPMVFLNDPLVDMSVSEDGFNLPIGLQGGTTEEVLVVNANEFERRCKLVRQGVAWSSASPQNIIVTYRHGFAAGEIPPDIEALASEVTWLIWSGQNWVGKQSVAVQGQSISLEKNLTPVSTQTLARLRTIASV